MYDYINEYNYGVSQPQIIKHFAKEFYDTDEITQAIRANIGKRLKVLESYNLIEKRKVNGKKGGLKTNVWRAIAGKVPKVFEKV